MDLHLSSVDRRGLMRLEPAEDTCTLDEKMPKDPRQLYAPSHLYHIIVRKPFRKSFTLNEGAKRLLQALNEEAFSLVMEAFSGLKQKKVGFERSLISTPPVLVRSGLWSSVPGLPADKISEIDQPAGLGKIRPMVRTSVPVDGRFEHLILSCNLTSDHAIIWIERESQRALDVSFLVILGNHVAVNDEDRTDYGDSGAAEDVVAAFSPSAYGTFDEINEEGYSSSSLRRELPFVSSKRRKESWDDLAGHLFDIYESGQMVLKK
ncbi:hypothetical protein RHSIM_Rhsim03G0150000 [Rhododendron simsii]|uniref:Uncharacterized protein n=1 Tax=Rhododendron simsii TaxID=118357 RepID=A0A834H5L8_RHOSS|nr:hypothetical protein RHSIM_Rhsim03G0150000 [Rhododendron simsii]